MIEGQLVLRIIMQLQTSMQRILVNIFRIGLLWLLANIQYKPTKPLP